MTVFELYMANCDWDRDWDVNTLLTIIDATSCETVYKGLYKDMPRRVEKLKVRTFGGTTIVAE